MNDSSRPNDSCACVDDFVYDMVWEAITDRVIVIVADLGVDEAASLVGAALTAEALNSAIVSASTKLKI